MGKPNPQNLRPPWKKGESGNPKGKPIKKPIEEIFQAFLDEVVTTGSGKSKERLHALIEAQWVQAIKGNTPAAKFIAERAWGMPKQKIEHSGQINTVVVDSEDSGL